MSGIVRRSVLLLAAWFLVWGFADLISARPESFSAGWWREMFIAYAACAIGMFL